jgi:hypothetical protein
MALIDLLILLIIVGVLLYLVNNLMPIDPTIKRVINIVVLIVVGLWLIRVLMPGVANINL